MFALGIHFLNGWMMGKYPSTHNAPEWPPHPDRVYMALAAAYFESGENNQEKQALLWLENLEEKPFLIASDFNQREVVTSYVPVNDTSSPINKKNKPHQIMGTLVIGRDRQPRTFPVAIPEYPTVYMVWPNINIDKTTHNSLTELCRKVTYVGHSASLVQMWIEESPPNLILGENSTNGLRLLEPKDSQYTRFQLRKISPGKLKNLKDLYPDLRPTPSLWSGYDVKKPEPENIPEPSTCFSPDIIILRRIHGKPMPLVTTLQLTKALRNTIMKFCPSPIPEWLTGHKEDGSPSEDDHMAIIPLPFVGSEHADGHLLGLSIVVPKSVNESEIARCFHKILYRENGSLNSIELKLGRLGVWTLQIEDREENQRQASLREKTLTAIHPAKPSCRWSTVTPIAIDRHPKKKEKWRHIEDSIKKACARIGLPKPSSVIPIPVSAFMGVPHGREFPKITRKFDQGKIYHTHAILEFPEPVRGPILIGAGRYRGYGLCRPMIEGGSL